MRIVGRFKLCVKRHPITKICLRWIWIPIYTFIEWPVEPIRTKPEPNPPWLEGADITRELAQDLQAIATMDVIASTMSEGRRGAVMEFLESQMKSIDLPEELHIDAEPMPGRSGA